MSITPYLHRFLDKFERAINNFIIGFALIICILALHNICFVLTTGALHAFLYDKMLFVYPKVLNLFINILIIINSSVYHLLLPNKYVLYSTIGAPILEELEFRSPSWFFRNHPSKYLKAGIAIFTSVVFGLCHVVPLVPTLCITLLGLVSCWMVNRTKKLWLSMALHSIYNCIVALMH